MSGDIRNRWGCAKEKAQNKEEFLFQIDPRTAPVWRWHKTVRRFKDEWQCHLLHPHPEPRKPPFLPQ